MKKKRVSFRFVYLNYLAVLVILVAAALFYVRSVLEEYENAVPEHLPWIAMSYIASENMEGEFWDRYNLPWQFETARLESGFNVRQEYTKRMQTGVFDFVLQVGLDDPDRQVYIAKLEGRDMAKITLEATSETMTKLGILTFRHWKIQSVEPIFEPKEYSLTVPAEFVVKINGIEPSEEEIVSQTQEEVSYNTGGLYLTPEVEITDARGREVSYQIVDDQIVAEFYYYNLSLPSVLTVELNGNKLEGEAAQGNRVNYQIKELTKPEVVIKDHYGNQFSFEGGNEIPLTYMTIAVDSRYKVLVMDKQAPMEVVTVSNNPEFDLLRDYVTDLPVVHTYEIAVLAKDAKVQVADQDNMAVEMEIGKTVYDFVDQAGVIGQVPAAVAAQVDALAIAQEWSLFMSNDRSFEDIKGYIVKDSYQYEVTKKYANSVDRKFFSTHTLLSPAFTDEKVSNFTWITDSCFSVDISFVKHMALKSGRKVDDTMNDRFYFVKWDDTEDDTDNPTWKIVSMKEIVGDAE